MDNQFYHKSKLSNGLTVVTERIPSVRSVSAGIWIKTGSRFENKSNNGIAHFLEHMMFKGTQTRTPLKIAQSLESLGGSLNAFTSKELTCYYATALDTHLRKTIEILSDMICNSVFPVKEIEREKDVILEEINAVKDTPEEYIFDIFHEKLFPDSALGRPILGTEEQIREFDREMLINFRNRFYSPENIVISVTGNIRHSDVIGLVEKYFVFEQKYQPAIHEQVSVALSENFDIHQPITQAHVCLGGKSIAFDSDQRFALLLLNTYLGGGMSSQLFQKLREKKGLAYSVYSFIDFYSDLGIFGVYIGTDQKKLSRVQELLTKELKQTTEKPVSADKLRKLKNQLKGNLVLGLESTTRRMSRLAKNEIYYNQYISIDSLIKNIDRVTSEDIISIAREIIQPESFTSVILRNKN